MDVGVVWNVIIRLSGIPSFLQMTANTAAVTLFSMSKAWKRSISAHKVGPGMLGMAS
jgi:hypothetical protein